MTRHIAKLDDIVRTQRQALEQAQAALKEAQEALRLCLPSGIAIAPEDDAVQQLCQRWGYGAVISRAAELWAQRDPVGALTKGPCVGTVRSGLSMVHKALKATQNALAATQRAPKVRTKDMTEPQPLSAAERAELRSTPDRLGRSKICMIDVSMVRRLLATVDDLEAERSATIATHAEQLRDLETRLRADLEVATQRAQGECQHRWEPVATVSPTRGILAKHWRCTACGAERLRDDAEPQEGQG